MKQLVKVLLFIWALPCCAANGPLYSNYCSASWLHVKNNMQTACDLIQVDANNLDFYSRHIEHIAAGGEERTFMDVKNFLLGSGDITLTYVCGQGMVSFKTQLSPCTYVSGALTGSISAISAMDAAHYVIPGTRFRTKYAPYYSWSGAEIYWSFAADPSGHTGPN